MGSGGPRSRVRTPSSRMGSEAAEPPPRAPSSGIGGELNNIPHLIDGVVYEFIAIPCGYKYSMPLGLRWGRPPIARIYRGTGLYDILTHGDVDEMILYSPVDPGDFVLSILHVLEEELSEPCELPRPYTVKYRCRPIVEKYEGDHIEIRCPGTMEMGTPVPYTRLYGAIVELLVIASKRGVGVLDGEFAANCMRCSEWALRRAGGQRAMELREKLYSALSRLLGS